LTIASQIGNARSDTFLTGGQRDRTRAVRAAMRHSRLVRFTRVALPVILVLCSASVGLYRWLDPMRVFAKLPVTTDGAVLSGTKIVMQQPRLSGFTKDERPYTVLARTAAKDLTKPDELELQDVNATLEMQDRRNVVVTARDGLYNSKADTMRLQNNVVVTTADYKVLLKDALVHTKAGRVVSEQPVVVNMLQGTINANRLEIVESGAVIKFERGVTMVIDGEHAPQFNGMVSLP
jgi:lipopolysaccharide export system protein LptC